MNLHTLAVGRIYRGALLALCAIALHLVGAVPAHAAGLAVIGFAGPTTNTFDLTEAMKVMFEDSVVNNVVTDSELMDLFETDTDIQTERTGGGRYIETAHMFGLNAGYGYRTETDYIPVPDGPIIKNGRVYLKKAMGSVEMTGDTFEKVTQGKEAFISWADQAMPKLVERMVNEKDRIVIGYGAGIKAKVSAIAGNNITVNNAYGITGYGNPWLAFLEGERLVFGPNANGTSLRSAGASQSCRLLDINDSTNVLTVDAAPAGILAADFVFPGDASGTSAQSGGVNREFMGLLAHVDDGGIVSNYLNIPRANHRQWRGLVTNVGGQFTEDVVIQGDMDVAMKGGGRIDVIVAPVSGAITFWKQLKTQRSINDPTSYTAGKGKLKVYLGDRVVEIRSARKLPPQVAFGLTKGVFKRYTLGKFEWNSRTGSMWKQVTDANGRLDAFWAYGSEYDEIACFHPRKNIRWEGLTP